MLLVLKFLFLSFKSYEMAAAVLKHHPEYFSRDIVILTMQCKLPNVTLRFIDRSTKTLHAVKMWRCHTELMMCQRVIIMLMVNILESEDRHR